MEHYYKIDRSSSLEHGIRDSFRAFVDNAKRKSRYAIRRAESTLKKRNRNSDKNEVKEEDKTRESGKKGNKSKYEGGFITKNGRPNNSQAYNHDYYLKNKDKWRKGENKIDNAETASADHYVKSINRKYDIDVDKMSWEEIGYSREIAKSIGQPLIAAMWDEVAKAKKASETRNKRVSNRRNAMAAEKEKIENAKDTIRKATTEKYRNSEEKWYNKVPKRPTEANVAVARSNAGGAIENANYAYRKLIKDVDPEQAKKLGWDKMVAEQTGYAVKKSLESMVTASRYKRQNSLGQKAKDAAEGVKKKATYYVDRAKNRASELTRKPSELQNRPAERLERKKEEPDETSERNKSKQTLGAYSVTNMGTGKTEYHTGSAKEMATNKSRAARDSNKLGNVSWEFGTPTVSDEYKKESEYNSRKNQYPNRSNNSSSDKYVTYKNKNMESGTLYKDKDGNIWKKLGGPGTNNWMKVN